MAAPHGTKVEGGPSNLLINKKTVFGIRTFEPGGREFESLRARHFSMAWVTSAVITFLESPISHHVHVTVTDMIFPRDTGHRVKNPIMTVIQNEVLDEQTTKNPQSGIQTRSRGIGG